MDMTPRTIRFTSRAGVVAPCSIAYGMRARRWQQWAYR